MQKQWVIARACRFHVKDGRLRMSFQAAAVVLSVLAVSTTAGDMQCNRSNGERLDISE